jgi:pentatricopeptide repeat protein
MIAIYASNSMAQEAVELFLRIEKESTLEIDVITLANVLCACGYLFTLELGKWVHMIAKMKKMFPNKVLMNALLDMYANCGSLKDAQKMFDEMYERDVIAWSSMILTYAKHGHGHEAIRLFEQMLESGTRYNCICFSSCCM